jgi:predicted secreted hydrolase
MINPRIVITLVASTCLLAIAWATTPPLARQTADGFAVPQPGRTFAFPRDHGSHPEFRIEWWYLTGHLWTDDARRFGFQATFFRQAAPKAGRSDLLPLSEDFGYDQLFLAHMAVTDVKGRRFLYQERLNRSGWAAAASTETLDLTNGNWSLKLLDPISEEMSLMGSIRSEASFSLRLQPIKPLVFFGDEGVSRKGADPTAASHYLTFSRLQASGQLRIGGVELEVRGQAWMDHEISSSQLDPEQVGWDWLSLQMEDGRELMIYRLRRKDGSADPYSKIAWVGVDGSLVQAGPESFKWLPERRWVSPRTGGSYPTRWRLETIDPKSGEEVRWTVEALLEEQELTGELGGIAYWEGACRVTDQAGRAVGEAFVELTGYAESLQGRF